KTEAALGKSTVIITRSRQIVYGNTRRIGYRRGPRHRERARTRAVAELVQVIDCERAREEILHPIRKIARQIIAIGQLLVRAACPAWFVTAGIRQLLEIIIRVIDVTAVRARLFRALV